MGFRAHRFAALLPLAALLSLTALLTFAALLAGCARPAMSSDSGPSDSGPSTSRSPSVPSGRATPSATVGPCPSDGVRFEVGGANAAMGLRVLDITLVNCGSRTYRLNGYPAVRSLAQDRAVLRVRVLHGVKQIIGLAIPWDGPPKPLVLKPGQRAGTAVAWRNTYDDIRRPPVTVALLRIAPLAGRPPQLVDPHGGLDLGSTGRIGVSAWSLVPDSATTAIPPIPGASAPEPVETGGPLL